MRKPSKQSLIGNNEATLGNMALMLDIGLPELRRIIAEKRKEHPELPFPEPVRHTECYSIWDRDELTDWIDRVAPTPARFFNRIAQRFIRGEFDRRQLQIKYKLKRIAAMRYTRLRHVA